MHIDSRVTFAFVFSGLGIALIIILSLHPVFGKIYNSDNLIVALSILVTTLIGWNILINQNSERSTIKKLTVYPLNGEGNATITVEYEAVHTQNYDEVVTLVVKYKSFETNQSSVVSLRRKHLPKKQLVVDNIIKN